ncbi:hypothetical protein CL630_00400 [bacterium]|nr:hypothetical protein [bacterium]|tara:strand:- start:18933 stop:19175 length:243 start_codon:yes stop_codon:yes gene_type:complete
MAIATIEIKIHEDKLRKLESAMQECEIREKNDLVDNALTLFLWAVSVRKDGREIASIDAKENVFNVLNLPALSIVRKSRS